MCHWGARRKKLIVGAWDLPLDKVETIATAVHSENHTAATIQNKILDIIDNQNLLKNAEAAAQQQPLEKREINLTSIKQEGEQQTNPSQVTNKEGNTYDTYDHLVNITDTEAKVTQQPPQDDPVQKYQDPIEKESTADTKHTQTLSSDEEHTTNIRPAIKHKEVKPTKETPIKINTIRTNQDDSSSEEEEINTPPPRRTENHKHRPPKESTRPEILDITTCLQALFHHLTDFCYEIQQGLFLVIAYSLYIYFDELGLQVGVTLFVLYQSALYLRKTRRPTPHMINAVGPSPRPKPKDDHTKTIYDNLKIPTSNKLQLKKKLKDFKNERTKRPYQLPSDFEDSLIIEEPVELKSYPSTVPYHAKFVLQGAVNNVPVTWEMDSGSAITLISEDIYDKMQDKAFLQKIPFHGTYTDFQGTTVATIAKYLLTVRIGEKVHMSQEVLVVDHPDKSQSHALLGIDTIRSKRLGRDMMGNSKAYLSFAVGSETKRIELQTKQDCYVTNTIEIESGETETVRLSLLNNINRINLTNVNDISGTQGVVTCEVGENFNIPTVSLCNLDNLASFQLPISNKNFGKLKLFAGQPLGSFTPLEEGTTLQSTSNVIETIGKNGKGHPHLGMTILKLSEHLKKVEQEKVSFLKPTNTNYEGYKVQKNAQESTPVVTNNKLIMIPTHTSMSDLDIWRSVFVAIKKSDNSTTIRVDFSVLPVISANYIQIAWHDVFEDLPMDLQLTHKELQIQKTSLVSDSSEDSSEAPSEDDLCESIFQTRRITSSTETWTSLLKHVPVYLRKKVFHLLTSKYPDVIAKSTVDFGKCTLPNSEFTIELKDNTPITCRPYPLNVVYKEAVEETVQDMVQNGLLIQESSAYGSGVFVRKEEITKEKRV